MSPESVRHWLELLPIIAASIVLLVTTGVTVLTKIDNFKRKRKSGKNTTP